MTTVSAPYPSLRSSVVAAALAALTAVLVAIRIVDQGALEVGGEVELGAPLALVAAGVLALAAARASSLEREREAEPVAG